MRTQHEYMKMITKLLVLTGLGLIGAKIARGSRSGLKKPRRSRIISPTALAGVPGAQPLTPVQRFNVYLDGFHFENGHLGRQSRACHYCSVLNEDLAQCVIFDGAGADARLIGVEYIVSERLFRALPDDEKPLWHSHLHEVKSGELTAPGLPASAELELMDQFKSSYGKIWQTWDTASSKSYPRGLPKLMMGFTEDGQVEPGLLAERDRLLNISTSRTRALRANLEDTPVIEGADAWQQGDIVQLELTRVGMSFRHSE